MKERESWANNLEAIIFGYESSDNPQDRFMAELLRELQSDAYKFVVIEGANNSSGIGGLKLLRILAEQDGVIKNFVAFDRSFLKNKRIMSKAIRDATKKINKIAVVIDADPINLGRLAINTLKHVSLKTIAAMSINENIATKKDIVMISFPTVFMNLNSNILPSQRDYFGLGVEAHFLKMKRVPIK